MQPPPRRLRARAVTQDGADPTGVADSTAAFARTLSGSNAAFVPPGAYKVCGLVMPSTPGLVLFGVGGASKIVQGDCGRPAIAWPQAANVYAEQTLRDLGFDGARGRADVIDATGAGGLTLRNLYFGVLPAGHSGVYVNGAAQTNIHDVRLIDLQIYASGSQAAFAGVRFGPNASDSLLEGAIMNGGFATAYGVYVDAGATSLQFRGNHVYNAATSVLRMKGCSFCQSVGDTWDNARGGPVVEADGVHNMTFTGGYIEAIQAGQSGALLDNASGISFYNTLFYAAPGAKSAVAETGTSDDNRVIGGAIGAAGSYARIFDLSGARSYYQSVPGTTSPFGLRFSFSGATPAAQAAGSSQYLGINGGQPSISQTAYVAPYRGNLTSCRIAADAAPGAGRAYAFTVLAGTSPLGAGAITEGDFSAILAPSGSGFVNAGDQITIQSTVPAGATAPHLRYACTFTG